MKRDLAVGGLIGAFAGYLGGLLGIGGGNFIIPALVGSGMEPKKASGTTAFVEIGHMGATGVFVQKAQMPLLLSV